MAGVRSPSINDLPTVDELLEKHARRIDRLVRAGVEPKDVSQILESNSMQVR